MRDFEPIRGQRSNFAKNSSTKCDSTLVCQDLHSEWFGLVIVTVKAL